jgi:hypothetical protein
MRMARYALNQIVPHAGEDPPSRALRSAAAARSSGGDQLGAAMRRPSGNARDVFELPYPFWWTSIRWRPGHTKRELAEAIAIRDHLASPHSRAYRAARSESAVNFSQT